ncbi:DUF3291 domain-containing protein [Daejeonella oryzae]|uniref:DUF3291 domain-containing protein n=1 Tax=Daejeonella oryzae TaxID=1122943 RepID=UPI000420ADAC|nr:DUF3291 domain-containing protein [Daejeonella oryzae]
MILSLTIVRYRPLFVPLALLAMALHRIPLTFTKNCSFWKLVGCGKNGSFDLNPDWQQWGLLAVWNSMDDYEKFNKLSFISGWWKIFCKEQWTILGEPLHSHGKWSGKEPFKSFKNDVTAKRKTDYQGPVAILTRATIRINKLRNFWNNVDSVASIMAKAPGYIHSFGIGEAPVFMQATFSIWNSVEDVKNFAYKSKEHAEVIAKTRKENWYSEELFARFIPLSISGTLNGVDPLEGLLSKG